MTCPKLRFPIWIIVFDVLELIIFVSQGLTQSTASLVYQFGQIDSQGRFLSCGKIPVYEVAKVLGFQVERSLLLWPVPDTESSVS